MQGVLGDAGLSTLGVDEGWVLSVMGEGGG